MSSGIGLILNANNSVKIPRDDEQNFLLCCAFILW